jgi:hypothetical protein
MKDKTLHAWGGNTNGELGVGDKVQRNVPTPVSGGGTWQAFDAGVSHSIALRSDGTLAAWGANTSGQLGAAASPAVVTPQTVDFTPRAEVSVSTFPNPTHPSYLVSDGVASGFPLVGQQAPSAAPVTVFNHGTAPLIVSAVAVSPGFTVTPQGPFEIAPSASRVLTMGLDTMVTGSRTGSLMITSNDEDETVFDILLSGNVLSLTDDTDLDGLSDAAEWHLSSLGFIWNSSQPSLVNNLRLGAPRAGLLTETQLLAGTADSIVVKKSPTGNSASVKLRVERSQALSGFSPVPLAAEEIANDGSFVIPRGNATSSEFFRFSLEPLSQP